MIESLVPIKVLLDDLKVNTLLFSVLINESKHILSIGSEFIAKISSKFIL